MYDFHKIPTQVPIDLEALSGGVYILPGGVYIICLLRRSGLIFTELRDFYPSPGLGATIFNFLNVKRIRPQDFALERSYGLLCLLIIHLNDPFSPAKAGERVNNDFRILHPAKGVKKPLKIKLVEVARKARYCHSHRANIYSFSFYRDSGKLYLKLPDHPKFEMGTISENEWFLKNTFYNQK